jgi:branched-chain amino acid transport system permease protein
MQHFAQQTVNGLAQGAIYALVAVGYSLVYGVLELINFAFGDIFMFSTFIALALVLAGAPFIVAVLGACLVAALLGMVIERVAYRPLRTAPRIAPTVSAIGAALVLENVAQLIWGPNTRAFASPLPKSTFAIGGVTISYLQIIIVALAAALGLALFLIVQKSRWGRSMRAIRDDAPTAELIGVNVNAIITSVYALGSIMGAIAGILFASYYNLLNIQIGFNATINAFTAAVIGGIGSLRGAFLGGLLLGLVQAYVVGFVASGFEDSTTFALLILILLVRPNGIFGRPSVTRA